MSDKGRLSKGELRRARGRAGRLGRNIDGPISREQAVGLREAVAARRKGRGQQTGQQKRDRKAGGNQLVYGNRTNTVESGRGSQRKGQTYKVKYDANKNMYFHDYGDAKKRVYIRKGNAFTGQYNKDLLKKRRVNVSGGRTNIRPPR